MTRRRPRAAQRGAISVEMALATPILLMLILGGVHLGKALATRHRVGDATGFAARAAALSGQTASGQVRGVVNARLGASAAQCATLDVNAQVVGAPPSRRLEVVTKCTLQPPFGAALLTAIGAFPSDVSASAAFPF